MKNTLLLILGVASIAGLQFLMSEDLILEGGDISAKTLPLDVKSSKTAYETATFGMG